MPLSPSVVRTPVHTRRIECTSYQRADGLYDIEGHLSDVKSYPFKNEYRGEVRPGEPIHDMWLRLTVDDDMVVRDVEAKTIPAPMRFVRRSIRRSRRSKGSRSDRAGIGKCANCSAVCAAARTSWICLVRWGR